MDDLVTQAMAARKTKDWTRVAELLSQVPLAGDGLTQARLAEALQHLGRHEEAAELCRKGLEDHPDLPALHLQQAELHYVTGDLGAAMAGYETYGRLTSDQPNSSVAYLQRLSAIHKRLKLSKDDIAASWRRTAGPLTLQANACRKALKAGAHAEARDRFAALLEAHDFDRPEAREIWLTAFDTAFGPDATPEAATPIETPSDAISGPRLMVSGMGWSGSGAVFDYFCENRDVTPIRQEYLHLEGRSGVRHLHGSLGTRDGFMAAFADFFFLGLLGFGNAFRGERDSGKARKLSMRSNGALYAGEIRRLCATVREKIGTDASDPALLRTIADGALEAVSLGHVGKPASTLLFDNMIHMRNLWLVPFVSNLTVFSSFRDPRSNYVARLRESRRFASTVESFIATYRKSRLEIEQQLAEVQQALARDGGASSRIVTVQFEEFVLSREYRQDLARQAGLDPGRHREHSAFKPWESRRNVFLHEAHEDQDAIRHIERELPEYCVDLHVLRHREGP